MTKAATDTAVDPLRMTDTFMERHLGPDAAQREEMLRSLGLGSLEELTVPWCELARRGLSAQRQGTQSHACDQAGGRDDGGAPRGGALSGEFPTSRHGETPVGSAPRCGSGTRWV